ncbi:MAG: aminomethyl transferase family protein [Rhodospirillaceae bacterium]|nr:aminomethyl transferase family protein [Rhodospirillaceae bacterium]
MSNRVSALRDHHIALGALPDSGEAVGLDNWNGMEVAWSYATDPCDEHDAVREAAGLFDVSGLRKVKVTGPDALAVVDNMITRDMTKIYPGKSAYGPVLLENGHICDDAIIANNGDDGFMVVHGSGESMERLQESAAGKNVSIVLDDNLFDISLQGPKSVDFLNEHTPMDLPGLEYFHHQETTLFGNACTISRTGYSGERGYEIFANAKEVVDIWEKILENGKSIGIIPCSFGCLDKVRVEAALLFYPYDMTTENTPWEVGLGWAISKNGDYRGKDACAAAKGQEKINFGGVVVDSVEALSGGETLWHDGTEVGIINGPVWSHRMNKSLALVHLKPEAASVGTKLEVKGDGVETTATVSSIPFHDPEKKQTHA